MRLIDADKLMKELAVDGDSTTVIVSAPIIKTKQIKYYDEDEQVWKVGSVIVNDSEKPNNSKVSEKPTGSERSSE